MSAAESESAHRNGRFAGRSHGPSNLSPTAFGGLAMAQVKVWYPKLKGARNIKNDGVDKESIEGLAYSFVDNVGHASLLLDGLATPVYVSWWPDESHQSFATPSLSEDRQEEGGKATISVKLDCLDEESIKHWWARIKYDGRAIPYRLEFFPADTKWTLDRNNCSHIVALAMKIGGAERYVPAPTFGSDMMTPMQIHAWAKAIRGVSALGRFVR